MAAAKKDFLVERGATFSQVIYWKAGVAQTPVDLTGCSAKMQVKQGVDFGDPLLDLSTGNGGLVLGTVDGKVTINISSTASQAFSQDSGEYDLFITHPDLTVTKLLFGTINFTPSITQ